MVFFILWFVIAACIAFFIGVVADPDDRINMLIIAIAWPLAVLLGCGALCASALNRAADRPDDGVIGPDVKDIVRSNAD